MRYDKRIVAIAKWSGSGLAWHRISEHFFWGLGFRQFRLKNLSVPMDSATAAALAEPESQFDSTIKETGTTASFCFGYIAPAGKRDLLLREQAIRNGRYGVLSVYSTLEPKSPIA